MGGGGRKRVVLAGVTALAISAVSAQVRADEVDDILAKRAHNQARLQRISAEYVVETDQPAGLVKNPKTTRLHYRMTMERMKPSEIRSPHNPWRMQVEMLEPLSMKLKTEGEQASFMDQHGAWVPMALTPELQVQFAAMSERYMGADPAEQRKHFRISVLRHNNPIFGPKTVTIELVPEGKAKLYARREEDVLASDGLAIATRLYNSAGQKMTTSLKVTKHHDVNGYPVVDGMESESEGPGGKAVSRTTTLHAEVEVE